MAPIRKGDGTGFTSKGFAGVRKGDGTILYSAEPAIPDSEADQKLIHRWYLSEDTDPFVDQIGTADGTNNGTTQVTGDWVDDAAREGDGTDDYIETTTWGSFGSSLSDPLAIAFTISGLTSSDSHHVMGVANNGDFLNKWFGISVNDTDAGDIRFVLTDEYGDAAVDTFSNAGIVNDGGTYRVVANSFGPESGGEIWVNQIDETRSQEPNSNSIGTNDFIDSVWFFARNASRSEEFLPAILGDICVFGDSLTQSEIESYQNPWE